MEDYKYWKTVEEIVYWTYGELTLVEIERMLETMSAKQIINLWEFNNGL